MIVIKIKYKDAPGGIQVRFFAGQEGHTLSCNGVLLFTQREFEVLVASTMAECSIGRIVFERDE